MATKKNHECENCGYIFGSNDRVCKYCGTQLRRTCAACGAELKPNEKVCPYCGTKAE